MISVLLKIISRWFPKGKRVHGDFGVTSTVLVKIPSKTHCLFSSFQWILKLEILRLKDAFTEALENPNNM